MRGEKNKIDVTIFHVIRKTQNCIIWVFLNFRNFDVHFMNKKNGWHTLWLIRYDLAHIKWKFTKGKILVFRQLRRREPRRTPTRWTDDLNKYDLVPNVFSDKKTVHNQIRTSDKIPIPRLYPTVKKDCIFHAYLCVIIIYL